MCNWEEKIIFIKLCIVLMMNYPNFKQIVSIFLGFGSLMCKRNAFQRLAGKFPGPIDKDYETIYQR